MGELIASLEPLAPRITAIAGAFILISSLYVVPMLIASIAAGVTWLSGAALGLWFALMNAGGILGVLGSVVAFLGGPITLAIAAVIAISALLYVAWTENWWGIQEVVAQFVIDVTEGWELVKTGASALAVAVSTAVTDFAASVQRGWDAVKAGATVLMDAWNSTDWSSLGTNAVTSIANSVVAGLGVVIDAATKIAQAIWNTITGYFTGAGGAESDTSGAGKNKNGATGASASGQSSRGNPSLQSVTGAGRRPGGDASGGMMVAVYIQAPIYGVNDLEKAIEQAVDKIARKSASKKRV
jgi:hypothetical protein